MKKLLLAAALFLAISCSETSTGRFFLDFRIDLKEGASHLEGASVWLIDQSPLVQGPPSDRGVLVCVLDDTRACQRKVEYNFCAARAPWQLRIFDKPNEERFAIVVVQQEVLGVLQMPELMAQQIYGNDPVRLAGPAEPVSSKRKQKLERQLAHLRAPSMAK